MELPVRVGGLWVVKSNFGQCGEFSSDTDATTRDSVQILTRKNTNEQAENLEERGEEEEEKKGGLLSKRC